MNGDMGALIVIVLLLAALLHWLPTWRRRGLWFSVTVAPGFDALPEAQAALRSFIVPLGMLAATALYLHANWLRLPERVPVHWGIDGAPNE